MTALIDRPGSTVDAIDLFCGFGGSSQGIHAAGADVKVAANHDQMAIDCHAANYPNVDHWRADIGDPDAADYVDPAKLPPARFMWASPSCKFHSPANAAKLYRRGPQSMLWDDDDFDEAAYANSERSRVTMVCPLRYAAKRKPELVVVENVIEAAKWGPGRDGSTFRWWLHEWEKIGYEYECLFLNSGFFPPCPQSRDRMYVVFWRKGNERPDLDYRPVALCESQRCGGKIVQAVQSWKERRASWPLPRWGRYGNQYVYACPECNADVMPVQWPAYTAINWENLGQTIGERAKPLAEATEDRIRRGLAKFRGGPPIVIPAKAVWGTDRNVLEQFSTQTTQQDKALVTDGCLLPAAGHTYERPGQTRARALTSPMFTQHGTLSFGFAHTPFMTEMRGGGSKVSGQHPVTDPAHHGLASPAVWTKFNGSPGDTAWHGVGEPFGTITGRDATGLVVLPWVDQYRSDPVAVTEQLATVMSHVRHALASVEHEPLGKITKKDLQQVRFRMLEPDPELRRTMAFDDDYVLIGNKTQMTSGLGNAVTPPVASWITGRCLDTLRGE